ncbi:hypothetical protein BDN67DRAFT_69617 [Paxillus ammoniavirescens]|nr:hypothetical protein BDN67DRAFT_69617 [Paxillus ammoniavirescens]
MSALGVTDGALLTLRRKVSNATGGRQVPQDAETLRLQVLSDPAMMLQLQEVRLSSQTRLLLLRIPPPLISPSTVQTSPELATAAQSNPGRFAELVREISERSRELEIARQREIQRLNADPFNIEAQRKIEEAIREQAVLENRAHALEWSPEAFARVTMLYVEVEVNSHPVKAFVDSGAQTTINCAEACGYI